MAMVALTTSNVADGIMGLAALDALYQFGRDEWQRHKHSIKKDRGFFSGRRLAGLIALGLLGGVIVRWPQLRLGVFLLLVAVIIRREVIDYRGRHGPSPTAVPPYLPSHRIVNGQ